MKASRRASRRLALRGRGIQRRGGGWRRYGGIHRARAKLFWKYGGGMRTTLRPGNLAFISIVHMRTHVICGNRLHHKYDSRAGSKADVESQRIRRYFRSARARASRAGGIHHLSAQVQLSPIDRRRPWVSWPPAPPHPRPRLPARGQILAADQDTGKPALAPEYHPGSMDGGVLQPAAAGDAGRFAKSARRTC
mgnify:CR=1 FL=1